MYITMGTIVLLAAIVTIAKVVLRSYIFENEAKNMTEIFGE